MFFRQRLLQRFIFPVQRHSTIYPCYNLIKPLSTHSKNDSSITEDYPSNIPFVNRQTRTPYDSEYFDVTERRKFGEAVIFFLPFFASILIKNSCMNRMKFFQCFLPIFILMSRLQELFFIYLHLDWLLLLFAQLLIFSNPNHMQHLEKIF